MTEQQKIETLIKYPNRTKKVREAQPVKAKTTLTLTIPTLQGGNAT